MAHSHTSLLSLTSSFSRLALNSYSPLSSSSRILSSSLSSLSSPSILLHSQIRNYAKKQDAKPGSEAKTELDLPNLPKKAEELPPSRKSLMAIINQDHVTRYDPDNRTALFSSRSKDRIQPGSIVLVERITSKSRGTKQLFVGVLIGIRRAGIGSTFTVRSYVMKTGVEMKFPVYSPMVTKIQVLRKADGFKKAKLYYLRDQPHKVFDKVENFKKVYGQ